MNGHVAHMKHVSDVHIMSLELLETRPLSMSKLEMEDILKHTSYRYVRYMMELCQERDELRGLVNTVMIPPCPLKAEHFLCSWSAVNLSSRSCSSWLVYNSLQVSEMVEHLNVCLKADCCIVLTCITNVMNKVAV
jgi:hypothetical protein